MPRDYTGQEIPYSIYAEDPMTRLLGLSTMRDIILNANDPRQNIYGPLEHGAFTQAATEDNILNAISLALGIPAYTAAKAMGMFPNARSQPSIEEMLQGYLGIHRALKRKIGKKPGLQGNLFFPEG